MPGTTPQDLKLKPLVEAILEVKWKLRDGPAPAPGVAVDPNYSLLLGLFFGSIKGDYPHHEALPIASFPEELVLQTVGHRFRIAKDSWPLVQLGPGVLTVNDTEGYTWKGFEPRCRQALDALFEMHPARQDLQVTSVQLRYINAIKLDFQKVNVFRFLEDKLKTTVSLPKQLFEDGNLNYTPSGFNWQVSYPHQRPRGALTIRFATAVRENAPILVMETLVASQDDDVPALPSKASEWLEQAHSITHDVFFKMIEGDLHKEFSGE